MTRRRTKKDDATAAAAAAAVVHPSPSRQSGATMPAADAWGSIGFNFAGSKPPRPIGAPGPAAPRPIPPTDAAPPVVAAAPPASAPSPSAASPSFVAPAYAPPEGSGAAANAARNYEDQKRARDARAWQRAKDVPQGEHLLVHAWVYALTCYPPYGMTVWLKRVDPVAGAYELQIPGDQCFGDFPDRKLFDEVRRMRRQPTVPEKFVGRIRAMTPDGSMVELQGGEISLPPEPSSSTPWAGAPPSQWGQPPGPWGAPPSPWGQPPGPWGAPPSPWGAPPWAMPQASPWGAPPPWFAGAYGGPGAAGAAPPWFLEWAKHQAQPPASVAGDPAMVKVWELMQESIKGSSGVANELNSKLLGLVFDRLSAPAGPASDPFSMLERAVTIMDRVRGDAGSKGGGITVHNVDGTRLVEDKDGKVDPGLSAVLTLMPQAKDLLKERTDAMVAKRAAAAATAAGGGSAPPARAAGAALPHRVPPAPRS